MDDRDGSVFLRPIFWIWVWGVSLRDMAYVMMLSMLSSFVLHDIIIYAVYGVVYDAVRPEIILAIFLLFILGFGRMRGEILETYIYYSIVAWRMARK